MTGKVPMVQEPQGKKGGTKRPGLAELEQVVRAQAGIHTLVAKALGVDVSQIGRWRRKWAKVDEMFRRVEQETIDLAESKLLQNIRAGRTAELIFFLKCKAKSRGYVERQEITGADGGPLTHDVYARKEVERVKRLMSNPEYASRACELLEIADRIERPAAGILGPGDDGQIESGGSGEACD